MKFVNLMLKLIFTSAFSFLVFFDGIVFCQSDRIPSYEDETAYEVYSAVLSFEAGRQSKSKNFVIRRETLRNFGALLDVEPPSGTCLRPDAGSAKLIGPAVNDYVRVNKTKWQLQKKLKIDIPYELVSSENIISIINPLTEREDWKEFYKRYPNSNGFVDLSAVGFNADKSIAVVAFGRWCGGHCGEGGYYVLEKKNGKWVQLEWTGNRCSWIS